MERVIIDIPNSLEKRQSREVSQKQLDLQSQKHSQIDQKQKKPVSLMLAPIQKNIIIQNNEQKSLNHLRLQLDVEENEKNERSINNIDEVDHSQEDDMLPSNAPTKWNVCLGEQKKGKFTLQQQKIISQAVGEFIVKHQITFEEFTLILNKPNVVNTVLKKLNFFNIVSSILPNRTANSCYRFLRRAFNSQNRKGKWTKQEQIQLLQLVKKHGKDWKLIGLQLKRTSQNVYDKYKSMGSQNSKKRRKSNWLFGELVKLFKQVSSRTKIRLLRENIEQQIKKQQHHNINDHISHQKAQYNHKNFQFHNNQVILSCIEPAIKTLHLEQIHWTNISKTIKTRSMIDCKNKFMQILEAYFKRNRFDQLRIIDFIEDQNVEEESQIDWQLWEDFHIDYLQIKNRFIFIKKQAQDRSFKSFKDLLKQLRYKLTKPQQ